MVDFVSPNVTSQVTPLPTENILVE
jgi:hypothetical protein